MATEQVTEQVAEHLEDVAEATRRIDPRLVKYFLGGIGVGAAVGFFIGYRFNREKIKAEAFKEAEEEISTIREHYQNKVTALENESEKKEMMGIVVEEAYAVEMPEEFRNRPLKPPVPINPQKRVFRSTETTKDKMEGWNFAKEMATRTADRPFIIHQDEFAQNDAEYSQVTFVYYAEDDILVDEHNEVVADRDNIVGPDFPRRFGHGTDDFNILYVRNPVLELDVEICRETGSYEEEVLGLEHEPDDAESS